MNLPPVVDEWADDELPGDLILLGKFNAVATWQLVRLIFAERVRKQKRIGCIYVMRVISNGYSRKMSSLDLLPSGLLLSLLLLLLFFQLAKEFAIAILRFGLGAGGHTLRWGGSVPLRPLTAGSSASSSSMTEISLLDATEDDSISLAATAGRCNRSRFCGTGARLNLAGRGAVLGGVFEVWPRQTTSLDLDEGGEDGCRGAAPFSMTARTTHLVAGTGSYSKSPPEGIAAAAASLGRVSSSYTQLLQGALAALVAGDSFWTATAVAAREAGRRPSVVKGREMFPALPLFSSGDEATPSQSPLHIANLETNSKMDTE